MATEVKVNTRSRWSDWLKIGLKAAVLSIAAVLIVQAQALAFWPKIALFRPLDSFARSALFTLVPVIGATAIFAWLVKHQSQPEKKFIIISIIFLLLSFIPDFALPLENKTLLSSSVAAFMHLVAGVLTVWTILSGYRNAKNR